MIVKNTTVIKKEEVLKTLISSAKKELISKYVLAFLILLCGVGILINGIATANTTYIVVGSAFSAFGVTYLGINIFSHITTPKRVRKQNPELINSDITYSYTIKEKSITASILNSSKKNEFTYQFTDIRNVKEEELRYVVNLKDNQVLYINKDSFVSEQGEKFFLRDIEFNKTKFKALKK